MTRRLVAYHRVPALDTSDKLARQQKAVAQWCKRNKDLPVKVRTERGPPSDVFEMVLSWVLNDPVIDGLVVERLSVPFASLAEATGVIEQLEEEGKLLVVTSLDLVIHQTPKRTMTRLSHALANLQNDILSERLAVGREKREARAGGRPSATVDIAEVKKLLAAREAGVRIGMNAIAGQVGVSVRTLERRIKKWKEEGLL